MADFSKIDKNFAIKSDISRPGLTFYDEKNEKFKLYGIFNENGSFRRIPEKVAKSVSMGVHALHAHAAGGRIRFVTDSPYIAISAKMGNITKMSHFPLTGSAGFDLYSNDQYMMTFIPPYDIEDGYDSIYDFSDSALREITINFPLYSDVNALFIGLHNDAQILPATDYTNEKPVVFYGSSITQGGCASRPGNSYQAILSRLLNIDYINLGFSGNAMAEAEIAEYISTLDMSAFVYDYDYNAPTTEHLDATHEAMFLKIREKQPDLPILMLSRPKFHLTDDEKKRIEIIKTTYDNAIARGDKNVYFMPGNELIMSDMIEVATVDNCHPNDSGFLSMALRIKPLLEKII